MKILITGIEPSGKIFFKEYLDEKGNRVLIEIHEEGKRISFNEKSCVTIGGRDIMDGEEVESCQKVMKSFIPQLDDLINNFSSYDDEKNLEYIVRNLGGRDLEYVFYIHEEDMVIPFVKNNGELNSLSYRIIREYERKVESKVTK
ncbi:hypothetical protein [Sulfuracidifex tepidarius]|uniref:Uncharacterized protein n=2 Tax=Sulfuracidifex tepidarius TaxID=1294262 RepID=A0A510E1C4_9CREN|nr:hypothetical protein [Sulfuracidifex tepidarius]BBG23542.1 hypothetical protein IC006_0826 [Sulfuracidifex tepidarius]BBG26296.1 hypothetical protein IC007_0801 [Sulfuracidifex tepidarius]